MDQRCYRGKEDSRRYLLRRLLLGFGVLQKGLVFGHGWWGRREEFERENQLRATEASSLALDPSTSGPPGLFISILADPHVAKVPPMFNRGTGYDRIGG